MSAVSGSPLFLRAIAQKQDQILLKQWSATPWMIDAFTGSFDDPRSEQMRVWLHDRFGREASPIHGVAGRWHRGGATINGWTWMGFESAELLEEFEKHWPNPEK